MKQYKLKTDFLHLKAWTVVDIFKRKDEWPITVTKYVISIKDWLIAEIVESTKFSFEDYFEEIKEEKKSIFNLKGWDEYYYLFSDWDIGFRHYYWPEAYKDLIENRNAFLIKEEAEKESKRRRTILNIKKYCFENNIEYKENVSNNDFPFYIRNNKKKWFEPWSGNINDSYTWFLFFDNIDDCNTVIKDCLGDLKVIFEKE